LQIRKSPQARAFFKNACEEVDVPALQLLFWVKTRWASLYNFLDRILLLQKVCSIVLTMCNTELFIQGINRFVQIADDSDEVPDLTGKSYSDFKLNKKDWDKIALVHEVLQVRNILYCGYLFSLMFVIQEPAAALQSFSSSRDPTVWRTIPILEYLQESWESKARLPKFKEIEPAIRAGLDNLGKWYCKTDETDVYFICLGEVCHYLSCRRSHQILQFSTRMSSSRMQMTNGRISIKILL
jgi:hypothetical protein